MERELKAKHDVQKPFPEEEEMEMVGEEQDERIEASYQIEQDADLAKTMQEELHRTVQEK